MADGIPSEPDEEQIANVVPLRGNLPAGDLEEDDAAFSTLVPAEPDEDEEADED
jgi:hypothetical protein